MPPQIPYIPPPAGTSFGRSPLYDHESDALHYVDICPTLPSIHIYPFYSPDKPDNELKPIHMALPLRVTTIRFRKNQPGSYIAAYFKGIAKYDPNSDTSCWQVLEQIISDEESLQGEKRMNDASVDEKGRFWVGEADLKAMAFPPGKLPESYGKPKGRLWRYAKGELREMDDGFICGSGMGWSPDGKTMYFNDSKAQITWAYDYDLEQGEISEKRIFIKHNRGPLAEPHGMAMDIYGNLWIAMWRTGTVAVYNRLGKCIKEVLFPAAHVTSLTWGGKYTRTLFVTSAREQLFFNTTPGDRGGHVFIHKMLHYTGRLENEYDG